MLAASGATAIPLSPTATSTEADLASLGCVEDNDLGPEPCSVATDGLAQATEMAISPDGTSLYATAGLAGGDMAVVQFARDPMTGGLTPIGCIDDIGVGPDTCAQSTAGLDGVSGIAVSPDGTSVYTVAENSNALVRFSRDPATGLLTPVDCISDPDPTGDSTPAASCAQASDGMDVPKGVAVSPDGTSVYVVSYNDSALVRFLRDPATGALFPQGCIDDTTSGRDDCGQSTIGLSGAFGNSPVALDPRGTSIYVASSIDDAVAEFSRDRGTKGIAALGCIDDNDSGPDACATATDGLGHVSSVALSPDGNSLYATSQTDDAVVAFSRDQTTGLLTPIGCIDGPGGPDTCAQSAFGVGNSYSAEVTPNGHSVFSVARAGEVVGFARDASSGVLSPAFCVRDNETGEARTCTPTAPALDNAIDIAVSPDGRSLYATSEADAAIQIFGIDPPETSLLAGPPPRTRHRHAVFRFSADEPAATFVCSRDRSPFETCASPLRLRARIGTHRFAVAATDADGLRDATPSEYTWRVRHRR